MEECKKYWDNTNICKYLDKNESREKIIKTIPLIEKEISSHKILSDMGEMLEALDVGNNKIGATDAQITDVMLSACRLLFTTETRATWAIRITSQLLGNYVLERGLSGIHDDLHRVTIPTLMYKEDSFYENKSRLLKFYVKYESQR